jgi:hypothetical protein
VLNREEVARKSKIEKSKDRNENPSREILLRQRAMSAAHSRAADRPALISKYFLFHESPTPAALDRWELQAVRRLSWRIFLQKDASDVFYKSSTLYLQPVVVVGEI